MRQLSLLNPLLGALLCSSLALADQLFARPRSASYRGKDSCPSHCSIAGAVASNWSVYHNIDQLQLCPLAVFLDFAIFDQVDDATVLHRLRACTIWGADWQNTPAIGVPTPAATVNATYQLGWWSASNEVTGTPGDAVSLAWQMQTYFANGHGHASQTTIVFGLSGNATIGVYLGKALQNEGMGNVALQNFAATVAKESSSGGVAIQLCGPGRDADHVFGAIVAVNGTFGTVQSAVQAWLKADCIDGFSTTSNFTAPVYVTAPPLEPIANSTLVDQPAAFNSTYPGSRVKDQHGPKTKPKFDLC